MGPSRHFPHGLIHLLQHLYFVLRAYLAYTGYGLGVYRSKSKMKTKKRDLHYVCIEISVDDFLLRVGYFLEQHIGMLYISWTMGDACYNCIMAYF